MMKTITLAKPKCSDCGYEFDESLNLQFDHRQPCPNCGSNKRTQSYSMSETIQIRSSLKAIGQHQGKKRPFVELFSGADFSYRFKKWMHKLRLINRDEDFYHEEITDPDTGQVIHKTKEKLSEHTGHGSAKKKSR